MSPTALLLFSGGIDSTQALYARCKAGLPSRTHYVHLRNWEGREPHETTAVRNVLTWLGQKGYADLITHTESTFDYGDLRYIVRDHNSHGLWAGIILADPKNEHITEVVRTFHRDSVRGGLDSPAGQAAERGWREPIERLTARRERPAVLTYPQLHMTKAEIVASLPGSLLRLCWWCRRPRGGRPCHECHTCRQVDAALAGDPLPPLSTPGPAAPAPEDPGPAMPKGNASRDAWAHYAHAVGVEVDGGATRNDIRDAVLARG